MEDNTFVVNIIDKPYKLKVGAEDMNIFGKAGEEIDKMVKVYSTRYGIKDKQDLLSMTLLHFATELTRLQEKTNETVGVSSIDEEVLKELTEIDNVISTLIQRV